MKKVYISGKIGEEVLSDATREKFARAEDMLRSKGYDVFNPTTSGLGKAAEKDAEKYGTTFYKEILIYDLMALKQCDAIYLLCDWSNSTGAFLELCYAQATNINVLFSERADAWDYLNNKFEEEAGTPHTVASRDEYIDSRINNVWLPLQEK